MEEKKLFLAIGLSLAVIISWSWWISHFYPIDKSKVVTQTPSSISSPHPLPSSIKEESIDWNDMRLIFEVEKANLKRIIFKDYQDAVLDLEKGLFCLEENLFWRKDAEKNWPYFIYEDDKKRIIKEFIFSNINNIIELRIRIQNLTPQPQKIDFNLFAGEISSSQWGSPESRFYEVVFQQKEKLLRLAPRKNFVVEKVDFLGFRNRYFCLILEPKEKDFQGRIDRRDNGQTQISLNNQILISGQEAKELNFLIYIGPQKLEQISSIKNEWTQIIHYGTFEVITRLLLKILKLFYGLLHNWGLAIICLSIFIYLILYPLNLKQLISMKKMQALQPQIEEIKKLYQNNPKRLNKEMLDLYRREKINPVGGCLPLILQIPIFFALYQGLVRFVELKGRPFLWIRDLAEPDRLIIGGKSINLLPILLVIIMFLQQRISISQVSTPDESKKMMSIIFPLILGIVFYSLPSSLVLYWLVNSILFYIIQLRLR